MPARAMTLSLLIPAILVAGCGGGGDGTPAPPPSPGASLTGTVDPQAGVEKVCSAVAEGACSSAGAFEVSLYAADRPELLMGEGPAGTPLLLGLTDPTAVRLRSAGPRQADQTGLYALLGGEQMNARTTALALVCMTPVYQGAEPGTHEKAAELAEAHGSFGDLVARVQAETDAGHPVTEYPDSVYQLATEIGLAAAESLATQGQATTSQVPVRQPWVEDVPGPDMRFVNPSCTYYALEIRDANGDKVAGPILLEARPGVVEFSIYPPQITIEDKVTTYPLGNLGAGTYYCATYKGLDGLFPTQLILSDFYHPASLAAVFNSYKGISMALSLALPKLPALPLNASTLEQFLIPAGDVFAIGQALEQGDALAALQAILNVVMSNGQTIALWIYEETGKPITSTFLDTAASIANKLAWVLVVAQIGNEIVPYLYDMCASPWSLGFNLEQSADGTVGVVREVVGLHRPEIQTVTATPPHVGPGDVVQLSCQAYDFEDPSSSLLYSWQVGADALHGQTPSWTAPPSPGTYNATCTVMDPWGLDAPQPGFTSITVTSTVVIIE